MSMLARPVLSICRGFHLKFLAEGQLVFTGGQNFLK